MQNKILIYFFSFLFLLFSCSVVRQCTQEEIDKELNNGNTDPQVRIIELNHNALISAFGIAFGRLGCTGVGNSAAAKGNKLNCDVELSVYTGSFVNGQVVADKDAYYGKTHRNHVFTATALGTDKNEYQISVPETGAFVIEYVIHSNDCNQCCKGPAKPGCAGFASAGKCKEGKPSILMRRVFTSTSRPPIEQNIIPGSNGEQWGTKACNDCDTCPEKPCY